MSLGNLAFNLLLMPLQLLFEFVYSFANRFVGHYGVDIIALSLAINLLVLPLYRRADAMQEEERDLEAKLAPGVEHIKKTFRGDERTMMLQAYYRRNQYSPLYVLRSAVSLFLEIPFFIAAYRFLSGLEVLNGVSLGPIADLGAPDNLIQIGGASICLLPVLMTLINVISTAIFTKGYPLKTKIQLYGMAAFFLVFLYHSPSGLVFYWTLNNVFSLGKTIVYKMRNPKMAVSVLLFLAGLGLIGLGAYEYCYTTDYPIKVVVVLDFVGAACCMPLLFMCMPKKKMLLPWRIEMAPDRKLYTLSVLVLLLLTGVLIPSTVVAASPQEFIDVTRFMHPMWLIALVFTTAVGTFGLWAGVFYWLANPKWKAVFDRILCILAVTAVVNYLLFGSHYGNMSPDFLFDEFKPESIVVYLLNLGVLLIVAGIILLFIVKWKKTLYSILLVGILTICCMVGLNSVRIADSVSSIDQSVFTRGNIHLSLSKNGKNVVVIMLDRALGVDIPYIFNEKPELKDQFDGFTYYTNVISYGACTNIGSPALYGGYEYTPVEINKRDKELLKDKQNEALKVMPVNFHHAGYQVTVFDPTYAGYGEIPDLSIYDAYPEINAAITMGKLNDVEASDPVQVQISRGRNAFAYSLLRVCPVILQKTIYNEGKYNDVTAVNGYTDYLNSINVLKSLPKLSEIVNDDCNTFLMMSNNATHEERILQEPDYEVVPGVDNSEYDALHADRFTIGEQSIVVADEIPMSHYHVNMATMMELGKWFDYMRQNDVYDNTRIILVSDHGRGLNQIPWLELGGWDLEFFLPLLLVKDFNSQGFNTSTEFMTNADVPYLAMTQLVDNPMNPSTGKPISNAAKTSDEQYILASIDWQINTNNGEQFHPGDWFAVHDDIWNLDNWKLVSSQSVLP